MVNKFNFNNSNRENLSYIIGAIMGDGCIRKTTISICSIDIEFLECIRKKILKFIYFHKNIPKIKKNKNNKIYFFIICSIEFCNFITRITNNKSKIPDFIMKGNKKIKINFLNGLLDAEGCVNKNIPKKYGNGTVLMSSKSEWIFSVKILFEDLKIECNDVKKQNTIYKGKPNYYYYILIKATSFIEGGGKFIIKRKQERLDKIKAVINQKIQQLDRIFKSNVPTDKKLIEFDGFDGLYDYIKEYFNLRVYNKH